MQQLEERIEESMTTGSDIGLMRGLLAIAFLVGVMVMAIIVVISSDVVVLAP